MDFEAGILSFTPVPPPGPPPRDDGRHGRLSFAAPEGYGRPSPAGAHDMRDSRQPSVESLRRASDVSAPGPVSRQGSGLVSRQGSRQVSRQGSMMSLAGLENSGQQTSSGSRRPSEMHQLPSAAASRPASAMPGAPATATATAAGAAAGADSVKKIKSLSARREFTHIVEDVRPLSPEIKLPAEICKAWQIRVAEAVSHTSGKMPYIAYDGTMEKIYPPLQWHACQLQRLCGEALQLAAERAARLQDWHCSQVSPHISSKLMVTLHTEVAEMFANILYMVNSVMFVLSRESELPIAQRRDANGYEKNGPRNLLSRGRFFMLRFAPKTMPIPELQPRDISGAFATMHRSISQLQDQMPAIVETLLSFAAALPPGMDSGTSFSAMLAELTIDEAAAEGIDLQFGYLLPYMDLAMNRLGNMILLVERWRVANVARPMPEMQEFLDAKKAELERQKSPQSSELTGDHSDDELPILVSGEKVKQRNSVKKKKTVVAEDGGTRRTSLDNKKAASTAAVPKIGRQATVVKPAASPRMINQRKKVR